MFGIEEDGQVVDGWGDLRCWMVPEVEALAGGDILEFVNGLQADLFRLAQAPVTELGCGDLLGALGALEQSQRSLDATRAHLLFSVSESMASETVGLTPQAWLADTAKLASGKARERFRVTRKVLGGMLDPAVDEALSAGVIGWGHIEVFARATNPRNRDAMASLATHHINRAQSVSFNRWKQEVDTAGSLFDFDGSDPGAETLKNTLSFAASDDFTLLKAQLTSDNATVVAEAVETVADELFFAYRRDCEQSPEVEVPDRRTLRALALVELCRRATAKDVGSTKPAHPEVTVTLGPDNFAHGVTRWGESVTLSNSVLFCAPDLVTVFTDPDGNPKAMGPGLPFDLHPRPVGGLGLSAGRFNDFIDHLKSHLPEEWDRVKWRLNRARQLRFVTPEQRRALAARDGGCVFPGCDMPHAWTDAHHIRHWEDGGPSDLDNLISLCRRHHGTAHRTGWNVQLDKHGWTHWRTPSGEHLPGQRHHKRE